MVPQSDSGERVKEGRPIHGPAFQHYDSTDLWAINRR